ncbi:MAG: mandelate racemase/muconate lactonizing enzyme family protein [Alphaproteobacteria bacterium]|nr:mandelate racemase/muconate lactonizing enzyme family protein [Alphaproteobacteria bacterium]
MTNTPLAIRKLESVLFRAPIDEPLRTSFGVLHNRPALLVRAEDADGVVGWGEVWCTFPPCGAEHRVALIETMLAPIVTERDWADPADAYRNLTEQTHIVMLQGGEPGPMAQAIAGVDIALWDIAARRAGQPLWRYLGGDGDGAMPVYASGLNPDGPEVIAAAKQAEGYTAFKLKIGFGEDRDLANLRTLRDTLGDALIMTDVNQGWDLETAMAMSPKLHGFHITWLEEPLACDRPAEEWLTLANTSPVLLAAGENLRGDAAFDAMIASRCVAYMQPDMTKWGGFSGCLPVARRIIDAGLTYCPHYLGGAIGLMASAHLLAAAGGKGLLEADVNPNPLREDMLGAPPPIRDGRMILPDAPGLGVAPDLDLLSDFKV